jgi:hypothetical protein
MNQGAPAMVFTLRISGMKDNQEVVMSNLVVDNYENRVFTYPQKLNCTDSLIFRLTIAPLGSFNFLMIQNTSLNVANSEDGDMLKILKEEDYEQIFKRFIDKVNQKRLRLAL